MRCTVTTGTPNAERLHTLFAGLDLSYALEPLTAVQYESQDTVVYRYQVVIRHNAGQTPELRGILRFTASHPGGIEYDWEHLAWSTGEALFEDEAQAALTGLLLHLAGSVLYHTTWMAVKSGVLTPRQEVLHA